MNFIVVFLGAGIGGMMRHSINLLMARVVEGSGFPFATLSVNIVGSLLMGFFVQYFLLRAGLPTGWRLFVVTGILGGFTTFSAFSLETVYLMERGSVALAVIYVLASVLAGITALIAGLYLSRIIFSA